MMIRLERDSKHFLGIYATESVEENDNCWMAVGSPRLYIGHLDQFTGRLSFMRMVVESSRNAPITVNYSLNGRYYLNGTVVGYTNNSVCFPIPLGTKCLEIKPATGDATFYKNVEIEFSEARYAMIYEPTVDTGLLLASFISGLSGGYAARKLLE